MERDVTPDYRQALARVAVSMDAAGITPSMLTDSVVNRWLASLPQSPTTRSNYRRMALTLWRFAADRHTLKTGAPASLFFEAWVRCGYQTGLRFSDQLALKCSALRDDRLYVVMNKTGQPIGKRLNPRLVEILRQLSVHGDGQTIFSCHLNERWIRIHFARICKKAGLSGTPKWLRRTGATYVEAKQPGMAGKFLGHLSQGLADKHYIDKTLLPDACPVPPEIQ